MARVRRSNQLGALDPKRIDGRHVHHAGGIQRRIKPRVPARMDAAGAMAVGAVRVEVGPDALFERC